MKLQKPGADLTMKHLQHAEQFGRRLPQKQRDLMSLYIQHVKAELLDLDIEAVMETLSDDPEYFFYGLGAAQPAPFRGIEAARALYLRSFEAGTGQSAMLETTRFVIDDNSLVVEGTIVTSGGRVATLFPATKDFIDTSRDAVLSKHVVTLFPIVGNRFAGETVFFGGPYQADDVHYLD
ncbi:MAG: hypothetical protein ABW110_23430 [Steroidobacteraceae bacterium]